ncbi:hypothetical protein AX17_005175 [Amanita inopinata Kibby_2008]|nr:hypothetical protein AX17_005175 [Amanita inopinata Kibby_2008]
MGNMGKLWKDAENNVIQIKVCMLIHDVKTRWDSTFLMIRRVIEFCQEAGQPFKHIKSMDDPDAQAMAPYILMEPEWDYAEAIGVILQHLHSFQSIMSKQRMPIIEILHPGIHLTWIAKHWSHEYVMQAEEILKELMKKYRAKIVAALAASAEVQASTAAENVHRKLGSNITNLGWVNYDKLNWSTTNEPVPLNQPGALPDIDTEFRMYVYGSIIGYPLDIDLFRFWELKSQCTDFPSIFAMALNYLPIQASSVPCKRAFSSAAETDMARRNPILMEALQMLKFGLNNNMTFTDHLLAPEPHHEVANSTPVARIPQGNLLMSLVQNFSNPHQWEDVIDEME